MDETTGRPDGSDHAEVADPIAPADPAVAALEEIPDRLAALDEQDLIEHPAAYDALHRELAAALDGIDRPAGTPPARPGGHPEGSPAQRPLPGVPGQPRPEHSGAPPRPPTGAPPRPPTGAADRA
jgi:hypothetical protein